MSASRYSSDNSNPEPPGDPFNGSFNSTMDRLLAAAIISGVVGTAATIAIVYFIIDCLKKAGTAIPSFAKIATNHLEKFPQVVSEPLASFRRSYPIAGAEKTLPSEVIPVTPPAISLGHNWEVPDEFGTLERFLNPPRFSSDELAAYTSSYATVLGSGAYGVVFKGELPNGTLVAVKVLTKAHDKRMKEQFMAEVSSIGRTHHINLYMENGSLDKFLLGDKMAIDGRKMHEIAVRTAKGIAYLYEECEQRIVHYDIKLGNILLDQNLSPKIADFGLAKLWFHGTHGYAAPEMSKPYLVMYKCDVYSFGMVLFDIMGRRINHDMDLKESMSGLPQCTWHILQNGRLLEMVCGFPESEKEKAMRMLMVALWCIQNKPEARPMMSAVVKMLEGDVGIPMPDCPFENPNLDKPSQGSGNGSEWDSDSSAFIIS
ncbi:hypothetical protein ACJRO7_014980 [Eucalyptus globulus]|uniref:Protein kinase domain-containing protein n=1 Tax=Eucalyptus globulus TaxID=34317 RepID=A0ABD3L220_EUCGL